MRKLLAFLFPLCCLLSHPAHSQAFTYKLLAGDVVKTCMIGIDTASYGRTRRYVFEAGKLISLGQNRIAELEHSYELSQAASAVLQAELQRTREEGQRTEAELLTVGEKAKALATLPLQKPLLADPRTYKVGGGTLLLGFLIGLIAHN